MEQVAFPPTPTILVGLALLPVLYYAVLLVTFLRKLRRIGDELDKFPGPKKHWLMGNLHQVGLQEGHIGYLLDAMFDRA